MERLLITGVDSTLGSNLALKLAERWDVLGLFERFAVESSCLRTASCDLADRSAIEPWINSWEPRWIIHCGPLAASSWDTAPSQHRAEQEPAVVTQLARLAHKSSARLCVLSSDVVFAGPRMFHEESWLAQSPAPRAAAVRAMERALEQTSALVVRTHAFGWSPTDAAACYAQQMVNALSAGKMISGDGRRHATPILATDLAEMLARCYELRLQGLYHLAGAERTSHFRFVSELAAAFDLVVPAAASAGAQTPSAAWHDETSLNSLRARRELEMSNPMLREGLQRFAEQVHNGWRDRIRSAHSTTNVHEFAA